MLKPISFSVHPKLAAVIDTFVNLGLLWWLKKGVNSWWEVGLWLLVRIVIWVLAMGLVYHPKEMKRFSHLASLIGLTVGTLAFLLFIEWNLSWYATAFLFTFLSGFSFWLLPTSEVSLSAFLKPHIRWRFVMSVVGLAGIFAGTQAIISFQIMPLISPWVWYTVASVCAAGFAGWWWWEYGIPVNKRFWIWVGIWFLIIWELCWVLNVLPLPYLVTSLILIWCWYASWLLIRFNFTSKGINWQKQVWFLSANGILFTIFLFFIARWK
jgi:hypothetical protein